MHAHCSATVLWEIRDIKCAAWNGCGFMQLDKGVDVHLCVFLQLSWAMVHAANNPLTISIFRNPLLYTKATDFS